MTGSMLRRRWTALLVAALATATCGDSTTGPEPGGDPEPSLYVKIRTQPHDILMGAAFESALVVAVTDSAGALVIDAVGDVSLTLSAGAGTATLTGSTTVSLSAGLASFPGLGASGSTTSARITASWQDLSVESDDFAVVAEPDAVDIPPSAVPEVETAILVDGVIGGVGRNDIPFRSAGGLQQVGVLRSGSARNEIIAFVPGNAPAVVPAPWTPGIDTIEVAPREIQVIPVTVWVVYGPFDEAAAEIAADVEASNQLFADQFAGIRLEADVVDVTGDPNAESYLDPDEPPRDFGMDALGFAPGRINVYAVRNIVFGGDDVVIGYSEIGGDMMLMAKLGWGRRTFPHEIGHILGLEHVNQLEAFPAENLMQAGGNPDRSQLTEGQTFRMHYDRKSALHSVLGVVPIEETRGCSSGWDFYSAGCPHEDLSFFPETTPIVAAPRDALEAYLTWECGVAPPSPPVMAPEVWERLATEGSTELVRMRALAAWSRQAPESSRAMLQALASGAEAPLAALARRLMRTR